MDNNKKKNLILLTFIYRFLLDIFMMTIMKSFFSYNLGLVVFNDVKFLISNVILLIFLQQTKKILNNNSKISNNIIYILFLIYFIPGLVCFSWYDTDYVFLFALTLQFEFLLLFMKILPNFKIKKGNSTKSEQILKIVLLIIILCSFGLAGYYNKFKIHLSLFDVYELREEYEKLSLPLIVSYVQSICGSILPFLIIYYYDKKKIFFCFLCVLAQLYLFSFGGLKTYLFYILCGFGSYYFIKKSKSSNNNWLLKSITFIVMLSLIEYFVTNSYLIGNLIVRRTFIVPPRISSFYVDYFSNNRPDYWCQSILKYFGYKSHYDVRIPYIIGMKYFGSIKTMANNGLVGDAYANFGMLGVPIISFLVALVLKVMDSCSDNINPEVLYVSAFVYGILFTNGAFWARLLTNGLVFFIIILFLINNVEHDKKKGGIN